MESSATYRLDTVVIYLQMTDVTVGSDDGLFFDNFFRTINKTVVRFGLCDIRKNNGLELMLSGEADNTHLDLDNSWYHKNLV